MDGHVLTFGRQPAYCPCNSPTIPYLRIEAVDTRRWASPIIDLKSERVQKPAAETLPGPETDRPTSSRSVSRSRRRRRSGHVGPEAQVIPDSE